MDTRTANAAAIADTRTTNAAATAQYEIANTVATAAVTAVVTANAIAPTGSHSGLGRWLQRASSFGKP